MEVKGPYMHANQRPILIQKWCDTRDIQLTTTLSPSDQDPCEQADYFLP